MASFPQVGSLPDSHSIWCATVLALAGVAVAVALSEYPLWFAYVTGTALVIAVAFRYPILLAIGFILLVPLMPKLPLIPLGGYLVPIRAEDVFLACALSVIVLRSFWKHCFKLPDPLTGPMAIFFIAQGLSLAFAIAFIGTIPNISIGVLYWLRTLEYFSAALICLLVVETRKQFRIILGTFALTVFLVGVYGVLQEVGLVPAFNAMHLSDKIVVVYYFTRFGGDRLISTFAGAYDLGAFYIFAIPVLVGWWLSIDSGLSKTVIGATIGLSLFCLCMTFARAPLVGTVIALGIELWLFGRQKTAVVLACTFPTIAFLVPGFRQRLDSFLNSPLGSQNFGGRIDTEWHSAIAGFLRSPVFGTGPSSLFEGMGVDCLYLLLLGMSGVVGLLAFLYLIERASRLQLHISRWTEDPLLRALALGLTLGTIGLLLNGITQDVFFSSKIALPYWFLIGLMLAGVRLCRVEGKRRQPTML